MMMLLRKITRPLLLLVLVSLLVGCTTRKRKDELSLLGKVWHNTTAHYNGYFNAEELVAATTLQLNEQYVDNYSQLLPVFEYTAVDNPRAVADDLDEAIKKVTIVVNLHPKSNWVDDSYLLAGQAQYLKQDYEAAEKTLRYLIAEYRPPSEQEKAAAKAKKQRKKGKKGSAKKASTRTKNDADTAEEENREVKSAKEQARERKRYNKEVKKRRKQQQRDRKKKRSGKKKSSSKPTTPQDSTQTTPIVAPPTDTPPAEPGEDVLILPISIFGGGDATPDSPTLTGEKAGSYLFKHRPVWQEGRFWLARTLIERDNLDAAQLILTELENSRSTFDYIREQLPAVQAHLHLKDRNYEGALAYLEQATEVARSRNDRARYAYIAAQLHQQAGRRQQAYAAFERVVNEHPNYEMEFRARLNMAQNDYLAGSGDPASAIKNLERMLGEEKNLPYQDQLYFALGEAEIARGDRAAALSYFEQSLNAPPSSPSQQAESYYRLGQMFFDQGDFVRARENLDQATGLLSRTDSRYQPTVALRDNLTEIATSIQDYQLQDSLLRISMMSPDQQQSFVQQLQEMRRTANSASTTPIGSASTTAVALPSPRRGVAGTPALAKETSWFAYDDRALKRGMRDFERKWGDRPLQDNWRRSSATTDDYFAEDGQRPEQDTTTSPALYSQEEIDKFLEGVPRTDAERNIAQMRMRESMFNLGRLYRDRLADNPRAITTLEELSQKYPRNNFEAESAYYLYLAYTDEGNRERAQFYYNRLMQDYSGTKFAQVLSDPNFAQNNLNEEARMARQYDEVYRQFEAGNYSQVLEQSQRTIINTPGQHPLKPKYAILAAMSTGKLQGKDAYIAELQKVVATYPETPEQTRAKEILRLLGESGARLPGNVVADKQGNFSVNDNEVHYVVVVFANDQIDLNAAKFTLSDFNQEFYKLDKIRMANLFLGEKNDIPVIVMRRFRDKKEAMLYLDSTNKNGGKFINNDLLPHQIYAISQSNYREIVKQRSMAGYDAFFATNYLN